MVALVVGLASAAGASEAIEEGRRAGHPRDRFPLALHAEPPADATLLEPVRAAVLAWNRVFVEVLGVAAFTWQDADEGALVRVRFRPDPEGAMGLAHVAIDAGGRLRVPIQVDLAPPRAMGQTPAETVLFQVAAHELGHAVGLGHADDAGSIMCCRHEAVNLADPEVRARYVEGRRRPDVRSVIPQLRTLYPSFWER